MDNTDKQLSGCLRRLRETGRTVKSTTADLRETEQQLRLEISFYARVVGRPGRIREATQSLDKIQHTSHTIAALAGRITDCHQRMRFELYTIDTLRGSSTPR